MLKFISKEANFVSMETKPTSDFHLPPGFRFYPSDQELILHYLNNKIASTPLPASIITDLDLYKYNPWDLPKKALFGEEEWYFFTPRDRKYPNGARPNRAAASGYWKATGTDKPILTSCRRASIGVKKALVFYRGRPPNGIKTDWIMHEYRLLHSMPWNPKTKGSMRLDEWVLCRVRQKNSLWEDQNNPSYDAAISYLPKVVNEASNHEMVNDYLYNECPMLPYIYASQDFSGSSISFQSIISDDKTLHFNNSLNPLKRKQKACIQSSKKLIINTDNDGDGPLTISNQTTDLNFCETEQSEGSNFSSLHWNSLTQFQELDHFAFT